MDWDKLKTIRTFDGVLELDNCDSDTLNNDQLPNELTTKTTTAMSLVIESLVQFVCLLLENDSNNREIFYKTICEELKIRNLIDNSYESSQYEQVRSSYQMNMHKIICAARGQEIPISLPIPGENGHSLQRCWSRYNKEFEEKSFIAGGGFGKVFRARHKLDCIEYAVKKIKINCTTIKLCHLAEVKTIASLNHPNIVQYKAAWLEPYSPAVENSSVLESQHKEYTDEEDITDETENETSSNFIEFKDSSVSNQKLIKYSSKKCGGGDYDVFVKDKSAILFIQMSLCQQTLQQWLYERNRRDRFESFYADYFKSSINIMEHTYIIHDIFMQLLTGLDYIHSKNIIHHDIKPSNIFLDIDENGKIVARLGDFGLACPLQDDHRGIPLGTKLYAAPEQLKGKCNPKSDVYSLGIVLLELLLKLGTDMERVKTIENVRKGIYPEELHKQSVKLLRSMLSNEKNRPTTKKILETIRKCVKELNEKTDNFKDPEISRLENELREKNKKIEELTIALHKKDEEIKRLKTCLQNTDKK